MAPIMDRFRIKVISGRAKMHRALKFPFEIESLLVIWPNGRVKNAYFCVLNIILTEEKL